MRGNILNLRPMCYEFTRHRKKPPNANRKLKENSDLFDFNAWLVHGIYIKTVLNINSIFLLGTMLNGLTSKNLKLKQV